MTISEPRAQLASLYGPVPLGSLTIACSPVPAGSTCDSSQAVSLIWNEANAIFCRKATSGPQRSKTTVFWSVAVIFLRFPVYGSTPHGASPSTG